MCSAPWACARSPAGLRRCRSSTPLARTHTLHHGCVVRCVSSCASRSLSDGVSSGHNVRFWHRLIQLLVPRMLCLHDFVRADQHWFLRQTVRVWRHVRADLKHVTARQLHRDSFPRFLVLNEGVVLIQNDPAP